LQVISSGFVPDVYQNPFNQLNYGFNYKVGKKRNTTIDLNIENILDDDVESVYKSYGAEDQFFSRFSPGRTVSIGVSHSF
jgi:outer membrane receptor protein involved in Fe transport